MKKQREILPIPDSAYAGFIAYDAKDPDSKFPPIEPLRPPETAPNVLIVLIDDVGFGASSAFGGPCASPTAERLAKSGLRYTRFHTTALCSPTRAALLSGRNHHTVGMGGITEIATSAPGYNSMRPNAMAPLPEILRLNGYSTAQFGKCHEVPVWEASPVGPFDRWPTGSGFEYFYGFVAGETNQWYPAIHEGTKLVEPPKTPDEGYHFMEDITDRAIAWVRQQRLLAADKPFFMYFAPGATHAPHHVPKEWADKYKGKFDQGWDKLREETFAQQKKLSVIPQDCELTKRPAEIPPWDSQTSEFKRVLAREMEAARPFDDDVWELYDATKDWSQAHDLSKQMPEKLHELQRLWLIEATRNNVLPMDDRMVERMNSDTAGRPELISGKTQVLAEGMGGLNENGIVNVKNKSHSVTAQLVIPDGITANGTIFSQGGIAGGWMLYVKNGTLTYLYNFLGLRHFVVKATAPLKPGTHQVRMEFAYDGGGLARGGNVSLFIDGNPAGQGRVEQTHPVVFSADETSDVGVKRGSPMTPDMPPEKSEFNGTVKAIVIEATGPSQDHLLSKEDVLNMIVARQ